MDRAEDEAHLAAARIGSDAVRGGLHGHRELAHQPGHLVGEVDRQRWPRGVSSRTRYLDGEVVGGRGDRPDPAAQLAGIQLGVAVHPEQRLDPVQAAIGDDVQGSTGQALLGGLEDEPDPAAHPTRTG